MYKHKLLLPDGSTLSSGTDPRTGAIRSVTLTEAVADATDPAPGAACAACLELELWTPDETLQVTQGMELTLFRLDTGTGAETRLGLFTAEQPVRSSAHLYRITAYDRMTRLDRDLSAWLQERQAAFPMTLATLVEGVCGACGLPLAEGAARALPNAGYAVARFYADGLTGRQLIQWAAQAAGRFARIDPQGQLTFGWYTPPPAGYALGPGDGVSPTALRLAGAVLRTAGGQVWRFAQTRWGYLQDSLTYEDYTTAPVDKVQLRQSDSDVGVICPEEGGGSNTLVVQGNLLLTSERADPLRPVARTLLDAMAPLVYTPLTVSILAGRGPLPEPGGSLWVVDAGGRQHLFYVMCRTVAGQKITLEATGNSRRDSVTAVNLRRYTDLQGKLLEVRSDIDGLDVKASELSGRYTELNLTVDGLTSRTENLEGDYTRMEQTVDGLDLTVVKKGQVRTQFAADASSVTVNSGLISFAANTLAIDSTNFQLTAQGNVTATGSFSSQGDGLRSAIVNGGFYNYLYEQLCASIYGYTEEGQHMGSMRLYGLNNNGGRGNFAVVRAMMNGGALALYGPDEDLQLQVVNGVLQARGLGISGEKNRLVDTSYGCLKLHTVESPKPVFQDCGTGVCDEAGLCLLVPDPRFAETLSPWQEPVWQVTATAPGALWVEPGPTALVHGAPGQTFCWTVTAPQRDYDDQYAECRDTLSPEAPPHNGPLAAVQAEAEAALARDRALLWVLTEETQKEEAS